MYIQVVWLLGCVLWSINPCRLFNARFYLYMYGYTRGLQTFFEWAFKIVEASLKFIMLLLYIFWDNGPIFMISGSNEQLQQELEHTLQKSDCHFDTLEERYAIKFRFQLGKKWCHRNVWNDSDYFWTILHESSISFWVARSLRGMMRGVWGVRKSIHQSWLAKDLGLGLLCWGFKGVQEEIPREEARTLQIGSVSFPPGQYTSPQLHTCHTLFDQDGHQDTSSPSL